MRIVREVAVSRHLRIRRVALRYEVIICGAQKREILPHQKVQTIAEINDGTDDEGLFEPSQSHLVLSPLSRPDGIVLPEVRSRAKPIVFLIAFDQIRLPVEDPRSDGF